MIQPLPHSVVCDTDVFSFLFNRDPVRGPRYARYLEGPNVFLPFSVVGELLFGAEDAGWGPVRRHQLERTIRRYQIEYPNYVVCEIWAEIRVAAQQVGRRIEREDAWVAATALYLDLPLVTHNARHYSVVGGLRILTEPDQAP